MQKGIAKQSPRHKWMVTISIDPDDDFWLSIGDSVVVFGVTEAEARQLAIDTLKDASFTYLKTWGINKTGKEEDWQRGDYSHAWFSLRKKAIEALGKGKESFFFGGNQTIDFRVSPAPEPLANSDCAPVAWMHATNDGCVSAGEGSQWVYGSAARPLYLHPPQMDADMCQTRLIACEEALANELAASAALRSKFGAREDEDMAMFVERLYLASAELAKRQSQLSDRR